MFQLKQFFPKCVKLLTHFFERGKKPLVVWRTPQLSTTTSTALHLYSTCSHLDKMALEIFQRVENCLFYFQGQDILEDDFSQKLYGLTYSVLGPLNYPSHVLSVYTYVQKKGGKVSFISSEIFHEKDKRFLVVTKAIVPIHQYRHQFPDLTSKYHNESSIYLLYYHFNFILEPYVTIY